MAPGGDRVPEHCPVSILQAHGVDGRPGLAGWTIERFVRLLTPPAVEQPYSRFNPRLEPRLFSNFARAAEGRERKDLEGTRNTAPSDLFAEAPVGGRCGVWRVGTAPHSLKSTPRVCARAARKSDRARGHTPTFSTYRLHSLIGVPICTRCTLADLPQNTHSSGYFPPVYTA